MLKIRLFGVSVCLDFTFFAIIALFFCLDEDGVGLLSLSACILHELGHIFAMLIRRKKPTELTLYGGGIKLSEVSGADGSFFILAAGCAVNFLFALVSAIFGVFPQFGMTNAIIGVFNLLPIGSFDGKQMLNLLFIKKIKYEHIFHISEIVEVFFSLLLIFAGAYAALLGTVNFTLAAVLIYLAAVDFFARK